MVLEEGVIKGRETFGNIIKYLNMTASSNFGNVFFGISRQRVYPVPADAGDSSVDSESDVRHLTAVAAVGQKWIRSFFA